MTGTAEGGRAGHRRWRVGWEKWLWTCSPLESLWVPRGQSHEPGRTVWPSSGSVCHLGKPHGRRELQCYLAPGAREPVPQRTVTLAGHRPARAAELGAGLGLEEQMKQRREMEAHQAPGLGPEPEQMVAVKGLKGLCPGPPLQLCAMTSQGPPKSAWPQEAGPRARGRKMLRLFVNGLDRFGHPHLLPPVASVATRVPNCPENSKGKCSAPLQADPAHRGHSSRRTGTAGKRPWGRRSPTTLTRPGRRLGAPAVAATCSSL